MVSKILIAAAGILAGLTAYSVYYQSSSIMNALVILSFLALFFHASRTWDVLWNSIKLLQSPPIIALLFIFAGYYIYATSGYSFWPTTYFSTGLALIGFAMGMIIYAYWNIA